VRLQQLTKRRGALATKMTDHTAKRLPRHPKLLDSDRACLIVIDVQTVLFPHIWENARLARNISHMIEVAKIHDLPVILTEHNPSGLGSTIDELKSVFESTEIGYNPLEKDVFSCCGHSDFLVNLKKAGRDQVIVTGMESHICVSQTVLDLMTYKYEIHVVDDAVRARTRNSHKIAIKKMRDAGAIICDWEMAAYELTYGANTEKFKELLNLMKRAASEESELQSMLKSR